MFVAKSVIALCIVFVAIEAIPMRHKKGIQIKNKGEESLRIEMTAEESFILPPGQLASVILDDTWSGTIFARAAECEYEKCNSPYTIAELTFGGNEKEDLYHVSIKDGFNMPMKIQPTGPGNFCRSSACLTDINRYCPATHQVKNERGVVIACRSLPELFKKICPEAVSSHEQPSHKFACSRSNTYIVSIG